MAAAQAGLHRHGQGAVEALKRQGAYESLRRAYEAARYQVESAGRAGWHRTWNRAHGLEVEFAPDGIRLKHRHGELGMRLAGYGCGEGWKTSAAAVVVQGNRVEYSRGPLTEWYVNDAQGLEQGFTLVERPGPGRSLVLLLETSGGLRPVAEADGSGVGLRAGELTVLRYGGLRSWDARGRELPSRLEVLGRQVRIVVEDATAEYPVTVDPAFTQQAKLTASDGAGWDDFGISVALSGDTALVGANQDDIGASVNQGSAYVFVRAGAGWSQQAKLTAPDGGAYDNFGRSVALSGDTALVGAPIYWDGESPGEGSAYVFVRSGTAWRPQAKLRASDGASGHLFGSAVALSGDTALVAAEWAGPPAYRGWAYVFVRSGTAWSQQAKLVASDGVAGDHFGSSVALSEDTALVGADHDDGEKGSAYVFVRSGTTWSQQARLAASDGAAGDWFGYSVALSGNTALVGAASDDVGANYGQGSAYVFVRSGTVWSQQAKLTASDGGFANEFGCAVALSGDTALVGAFGAGGMYRGAAYVFSLSGATWSQQQKLLASDGASFDYFGSAVALSADTALVGAREDSIGANSKQGSAYVFDTSCLFMLTPPGPVSVSAAGASGQTVTVSTGAGCGWSAVSSVGWITITAGSTGTGSGAVRYNVGTNTGGFRIGTIAIAGRAFSVYQAPQGGRPPAISAEGVVNAASGLAGAVAPGQFVSIYGAGLGPAQPVASQSMEKSLGYTRVFFNGIEAFLTYTAAGQANALVPYGIAGSGRAELQVEYQAMRSNSVFLPVAEASPGIFTQQYGAGQAWVVNQDFTFNSERNPAARGSYVAFWATGQGLVSPAGQDGETIVAPNFPQPRLPVRVTIGGVPAEVAFAGLIYTGVLQVNARVPGAVTPGNAAELLLVVGNSTSRKGVTLAVR